MPERARHMIRMIAAGLMVLAVLMLTAVQVPLGASGDAHHAHAYAVRHHLIASAAVGRASAPGTGQCGHQGHILAYCMASCMVAPASLPTEPHGATPSSDITVVYRAVVFNNPMGVVPDPALRPPERIG
jgi:hypothetical protein